MSSSLATAICSFLGSPELFIEINMLGETVQTWKPPTGYPIDSHDGVPTDHGTILYLTNIGRAVTNFPNSDSNKCPVADDTNH